MLEPLITSKPRIRLVKFFINATSLGHLHGFAAVVNESAKVIRKELNNLCEVGYLVNVSMQNQPKTSFIFNTSKIVYQHLGLNALVMIILVHIGYGKNWVIGNMPTKMIV